MIRPHDVLNLICDLIASLIVFLLCLFLVVPVAAALVALLHLIYLRLRAAQGRAKRMGHRVRARGAV